MEHEEYEKAIADLLGSKEAVNVLEKKRELEKQIKEVIDSLGDDLDKWERKKEDTFRRYKEGQIERDEKTQIVMQSSNMIMMLKKEQMRFADLRIKLNSSFSL